jgi:hypothetical protein
LVLVPVATPPGPAGAAAAPSADEVEVRRFDEEMRNSRRNELADEWFSADHVMHNPADPRRARAARDRRRHQGPSGRGRGSLAIEEMQDDRVTVQISVVPQG